MPPYPDAAPGLPIGPDGGRIATVLDVDVTWARIAGWLSERAPLTASHVQPPASPEQIAEFQRGFPTPLPDDLVHWWRAVDGFTRWVIHPLIPTIHVPVPISEARRLRGGMLDLMRRTGGDPAAAGPTGAMSHDFLETFVPIAVDGCGQIRYVDVRDGPEYGCVVEWDHQQGALFPVIWDGVGSMLTDIADALLLGSPARTAYAARLRQGRFHADVECYATVTADGELTWDRVVSRGGTGA